MATKEFYATGDFRYGTRRLRAGDPVEMDAPSARLFTALNKISPDKPGQAPAPQPEPRKRAAAKRTTRRKK